MGKVSKISYVDSSWSPWYGCTKVSDACLNCYAETQETRYGHDFSTLRRAADATFYAPLRWRKDPFWESSLVFVCELSDFWHPDADGWRRDAYAVMDDACWHTYLLLTKRIERVSEDIWWMDRERSNTWLGVTAENQEQADKRIPLLLDVPAAKRWVSVEPILDRVYLSSAKLTLLDWVIVGSESGLGRRPCNTFWIQDVVDQCRLANVPVFVKQGSHLYPGRQGDIPDHLWKIKEIPA